MQDESSAPSDWDIFDNFWPTRFKVRQPLYKHSIFVVFGLVSILPSVVLCFYNIAALIFHWNTLTELGAILSAKCLFVIMLFSGVLFLAGFVYVFVNTYFSDF
jgi:hypothetical protein